MKTSSLKKNSYPVLDVTLTLLGNYLYALLINYLDMNTAKKKFEKILASLSKFQNWLYFFVKIKGKYSIMGLVQKLINNQLSNSNQVLFL